MKRGTLSTGWKPEDLEKFNKKVQQAADIYSKLEVAPGYYVNGEISTGEIMADLGGLTVAIDIAQKKATIRRKSSSLMVKHGVKSPPKNLLLPTSATNIHQLNIGLTTLSTKLINSIQTSMSKKGIQCM